MRVTKVIETAEELAGLIHNRNVPMPAGVTVPTLPDGSKLIITPSGQVRVVAEGFANDPIHYFDLIRIVALGYGVVVEASGTDSGGL
jgi:hypothetical protein